MEKNNNCGCNAMGGSTASANKSIECTVKQCKNHCQNEDYCSLSAIRVSTHETNPTEIKCTDCSSFVKKA